MRYKLSTPSNYVMGIPRIYWGEYVDEVTPMNDEQAEYITKLVALERGKIWSLVVLGTVGNGKTRLASDLCSLHEYYHPYETLYTTQERLTDECRATFSAESTTSEATVIRKYQTASLLVIDEITTRNWTDYTKNLIQRICSYRHEQNLRTLIIGNLDVQTFKQMFDPHIISRFREGDTHIMTAPDMRLHGDF